MSAATFDVSVVGLTILDVLGRPVAAIPPGGSVAFIDEIRLTVAGTAGGTVIDCAKLGLSARLVAAVGDDEKADFVEATLRRHGIDTALVRRIAGVPTSATIVNIRPNGDRPALHQRGASDHFTVTEAEHGPILDARFVHLGGTGLLAGMDGAPSVALMRAAKRAGRTTTYDLIAANADTLARPVLPFVDYFVPSIEEARAMCAAELGSGAPAGDVARLFRDAGAACVVLTMGDDGCLVLSDAGTLRLPAYEVRAVDSTGCGDAFTAGLIAALARGWDLERAARFLYLQRMAFGGKVVGRSYGVTRTGPARFDLTKLVPMLDDVHERLAPVHIERLHWSEFVAKYDTPGTLFYLDPPYHGSEGDYGAGLFGEADFAAMATQLGALQGRFILSLNASELVRDTFAGFSIEEVETRYQVAGMARSAIVPELIIASKLA